MSKPTTPIASHKGYCSTCGKVTEHTVLDAKTARAWHAQFRDLLRGVGSYWRWICQDCGVAHYRRVC
ncbi:MAG: hypothetical protein OXG44_06030 [Gammaproteobacteria bacterium]|nr:hypothetical protein [Gammaproteobacteria bacterium]